MDLILALTVFCRYDTHTAQEPGSLFGCHAVVSIRFTHFRSFVCRGRLLQNLRRIVLSLVSI